MGKSRDFDGGFSHLLGALTRAGRDFRPPRTRPVIGSRGWGMLQFRYHFNCGKLGV